LDDIKPGGKMIFNLTILILGLVASIYVFWRLPDLDQNVSMDHDTQLESQKLDRPVDSSLSISIIIPARNEAETLPLLLSDLKQQTMKPLEIICVNDGSEDQTRDVVLGAGDNVMLIDVFDKPADWMGKAWACLKGAEKAKGQLLLFLDADVRLTSEGLAKMCEAFEMEHCTISVQPYHRIFKAYEQLSLFFNIILIGANGTGLPAKNFSVGLYGPVILISKADYDEVGGHKVAQHAIADDLALGDVLTLAGKKYRLFVGGRRISFRMYGGGIKSLFLGWTKNFATGAGKTPVRLFLPMVAWVTSCTAAPLYLLQALFTGEYAEALVYLFFYGIWVAELHRIVPKIGNFPLGAILFYPVFMLVFLATFCWSLWKKLFHQQVTWKGRKMKPEA
jgi:4,4'-diaponeurosporenoate glycosyltransferase